MKRTLLLSAEFLVFLVKKPSKEGFLREVELDEHAAGN
jgi:hypothetical protein